MSRIPPRVTKPHIRFEAWWCGQMAFVHHLDGDSRMAYRVAAAKLWLRRRQERLVQREVASRT